MKYIPEAIYFEVDMKLHRGWEDGAGRFTLEQCNLAKANAVANLTPVFPEDLESFDEEHQCQHCFVVPA